VSPVVVPRRRAVRAATTRTLSIFAGFAVAGLLAGVAIAPMTSATASEAGVTAAAAVPTQQLDLIVAAQSANDPRDTFGAEAKPVVVVKPASSGAPRAAVPTDPATAQGIGYQMMIARGWGDDQWGCLVALWNKESHWNVYAGNPSSGAYGIPQAVPGSKMAAAGPDWQSNPATQIAWGLSYIAGRYGNPCAAWAHSQASNWY